jgi:hypothetical protein
MKLSRTKDLYLPQDKTPKDKVMELHSNGKQAKNQKLPA